MNRLFFIYLLLFISGLSHAQTKDFPNIKYHRADSVANNYKGESLKNIPLLVNNLTEALPTKIEKFRAIYTWVCTNVENDHWAFLKNKRNRNQLRYDSLGLSKWNLDFGSKIFYTLIKDQKTVCTGYAYLLYQMAGLIELNCKIINGYSRSPNSNTHQLGLPNHTWNAIELNNVWYLCDATWSSGSFDLVKNTFVPEYNDGYFLTNPELFVKNHYPLDTNWILMENKPSQSEFVTAPIIYKDAFRYRITPIEPKLMNLKAIKGEYLTLLLDVPKTINTDVVRLELVVGNWKQPLKPEMKFIDNHTLQLRYKFGYTGHFDFHVKYHGKEIATYVVTSKRAKKK